MLTGVVVGRDGRDIVNSGCKEDDKFCTALHGQVFFARGTEFEEEATPVVIIVADEETMLLPIIRNDDGGNDVDVVVVVVVVVVVEDKDVPRAAAARSDISCRRRFLV
eukprot:gene956-272_t